MDDELEELSVRICIRPTYTRKPQRPFRSYCYVGNPVSARRVLSLEYRRLVNKARHEYEEAIRKGILVRQPCSVCGLPNAHGHHDDYNKPLEVVWLCPKHHGARHKEINDQRAAS